LLENECICPDDAEDNGQFFLVPYFVMFAKIGHHSGILLAKLGYLTRYETQKKGYSWQPY
jgi:hypothetical protein